MRKTILEALAERPLLCDGAMGTQLMAAGLEQGGCGEAWNIDYADRVVTIQRRYVDAGSDCLITNTFGGCGIMLSRHGRGDDAVAINRAAVRNARTAFGDEPGFVIGDVGPFGGVMKPWGDTAEEEVRDTIAEQVRALVAEGVDAVVVETQTALEELGIGIAAAREAGASCVIGSMAYDSGPDGSTRTMFGVTPEAAAEFMAEAGANIVALNCGSGMDMTRALDVIRRYATVCDLPMMAQPNAGKPEVTASGTVYKETPEEMVKGVAPLLDAGVRIIGACCGSTPNHIRAFRTAIDEWQESVS